MCHIKHVLWSSAEVGMCPSLSANFWSGQHISVAEREHPSFRESTVTVPVWETPGKIQRGEEKKGRKKPQKSKPNPRTVSSQLANSHTETRHSLVFKEPILGPAARDENFIPDHRHPKFLLMGLVLNSSKETSFPFLLLSPPISFFTLPSPSEPDGNSSFSIWWTTLPHRKEEVAPSEEVEAESAPLVNTKAACLATNGNTNKKYLVKPLKQTRNICKDSYNVVLLLPLPHFRSCMLIHSIYREREVVFSYLK